MPVSPRSRTLILAHVALLLAQALVLFAFADRWSIIHGFPLDDAWIHQVVARTFAETGTLGYVKGHYGAGATSYLWAALLSMNFRFLHADPVIFTLVVNVLATLASGQILLAMVLRAGAGTVRATLVALLAMSGANVLWFAYSGMEATLVVLLVLVSTFLYVHPSGRPRATAVGAGLAAAALALTRPEAGTHTVLLLLLTSRIGRSRGDAARLLVPWVLAIGFYVGSNWLLAGSPLPATLGGRRWLWLEGSAGLSYASIVLEFAADWLARLRNYTLGTSATALLWISMGLAAYGCARLVRARAYALLVVIGWAFVHFATYVVMMPATGHGGRYQPLTPLVYLLTAGLGATFLFEDLRSMAARKLPAWTSIPTVVAALVPWAALVAVGVRDSRGDHAKAVTHIRATECAVGLAIRELPADARVASFDIGGSGYFADRPVLDAGGLSDPSSVPLLKEGRIWEYLRDHRVDYVVLPLGYQDKLPDPVNFGERMHLFDNPALDLTPVRFFETPFHVWFPGVKATQHAAPRQGIFKVTYTGKPGSSSRAVRGAATPVDDAERLVPVRARALLDHALAVLAGSQVRAHLKLASRKPEARPAPSEEWQVELGVWGVEVTPPRGQTVVSRELATAFLAEQLAPYLELGDNGGAARAAVRAIAELVRRWIDPGFYAHLPAVDPPGVTPDANAPDTTVAWGVPMALAILGGALALGQLARRRRGDAATAPEPEAPERLVAEGA